MESKTRHIEFAIEIELERGPLTLEQLDTRLHEAYPQFAEIDRRWIGVAQMHLNREKKIGWPRCSAEHNHQGSCVIERVRA